MKVRRGDVVLIDPPFSDGSQSKVRPALVVQNDHRNGILAETIVAFITKNVRHAMNDPTQVLIDIGTPEGKLSGLNVGSTVKCGKLFTINESLLGRKIGVLMPPLISQVDDCLKIALELT